mgnify:CR=1 FL=1
MTVEELNSVLELKAKIDRERHKLETLKVCSQSVVKEVSDLPRSKGLTSPTEKFAVEIVSTEKRLIDLQNQLVEVAASVAIRLREELANQNPLWQSVMIRRYCGCMTFKEIGASLGYTKDYVQLLHRRAKAFLFQANPSMKKSA